MTMYEQIGSEGGVPVLLDGLYTRALSDPVLKAVFGEHRVPRLKAHQYAFITQAVGGPHQYSGRSLVAAHGRLKIEDRHFDAFVAHLRSVLEDLGAHQKC